LTAIIISIKPKYAEKIYAGTKTIELRRSIGTSFQKNSLCYIYASSPARSVTGEARIASIELLSIAELKATHCISADVSASEMDIYFQGKENGYAIRLRSVFKYKTPIPLQLLREFTDFHPPQSYRYASDLLIKYLETKKCI